MNEEIKLILSLLEISSKFDSGCTFNHNEVKQLLKYITNLQQKYDIAQKDIESLKNNYNNLIKMSENKIDNLQQENEGLKQTLHNITINGVQEENTTVLDLIEKNKRLKEEKSRLLYNLEKVCEERDEEE